jgi:ribosomal protein S13
MPIDPERRKAAEDACTNLWQEAFKKLGITAEKRAKELKDMGFSDVRDYFKVTDEGDLRALPFEKIKNGKTKAIKRIRQTVTQSETEGVIKVHTEYEFYDKLAVLKEISDLCGDRPAEKQRHEFDLPDNVSVSINIGEKPEKSE